MDILTTQLPQLIISILVLIGIFLLLILRIITTSDPVFIIGSGSAFTIILGYWFTIGITRQQHTKMMEALALPPPQTNIAPVQPTALHEEEKHA